MAFFKNRQKENAGLPALNRDAHEVVQSSVGGSAGIAVSAPSIDSLYSDHFLALVAYLRASFGAGPPEPEDVAQRAFGQLAAKGDLSGIHNLKAFLWRTAWNIALSDKRAAQVRSKRKTEIEILFSAADGYTLTPERVLEGKEQVSLAVEVLRHMPEQRRRAFILTRIEGLSHAETSKRLGISRPAVSKHVARATADLYEKLMKP